MHKKKHKKAKQSSPEQASPKAEEYILVEYEQRQVEELPCVEWGDRLNSGKNIARGGKKGGYVPGAMPSR